MAPPAGRGLPGMPAELARVEEALRASVITGDAFLTQVASHLIVAGGKRSRPELAVASGACAAPDRPVDDGVVLGGVAVELVHLGSLYHDDVIDEAPTRRGAASVNALWGNLRAILVGDFLLAKASEIAASLGTEVAGLLASTIGRLSGGEVQELQTAYQVTRTKEEYLAAIGGKTACLFAAPCRIGAIVAGLDRPAIDALTDYGMAYGMAFQIVDDVLDVVATDEELGKPTGIDLATGVYTLPTIRALASPVEGAELAEVLGHPLDRADVDRARKLVRSQGAVDEALAVAETYGKEAVARLQSVPDSPAVEHLQAAVDTLLDRVPPSR